VLRQQQCEHRRDALASRVNALSGPGDLVARDVADAVVEGSEVRRALATLSQRDREALVLIAWLDLSAKDAAVVVGCLPATFLVRLHRARRRLDRPCGPAGPSPPPAPCPAATGGRDRRFPPRS
jgi:DNA-directed RNA polymerase specialized sigma24 family protein